MMEQHTKTKHEKDLFKRTKGVDKKINTVNRSDASKMNNKINRKLPEKYAKSTSSSSTSSTSSIRKLGTNSKSEILPMSNCHSNSFTTSISISGKVFDVVIDTSTSSLWVPSSKCSTGTANQGDVFFCDFFNKLDTTQSSVDIVDNNFIAFAPTPDLSTMELQGDSIMDGVQLGSVSMEKTTFGAISTFPQTFYPACGNVDGVIGLGKSKNVGDGDGDSFIENLVKDLKAPIVSFFLNGDVDDYVIHNRRLKQRQRQRRNLQEGEVLDDYEIEEVLEAVEEEYDEENYEDAAGDEEYDDVAEVQDDFGNDDHGDDQDDELLEEEMEIELDEELQQEQYYDDEGVQSEEEYDYHDEIEGFFDKEGTDDAHTENAETPGELEYGEDDEYNAEIPGEIEYEEDDEEYYEEMVESGNIPGEEEYNDYEAEQYDNEGALEYGDDQYEEEVGDEYTPRPIYARSELILGGVNPKRYEGCLFWHPTINDDKTTWTIKLAYNNDSKQKTTATIASATQLIHGPTKNVGQYLTANKAKCYELDDDDELGPKLDTCENGYDVAFFDCTDEAAIESFVPLQFVAQGQLYSLNFDDLIESYADDSTGEELCLFRLKSSDIHDNHWVFGTPFFTKYYIALDAQKGYVGIALQYWDNDEFCEEDKNIFVGTNTDTPVTSVMQSAATTSLISSKSQATTNAADPGASSTTTSPSFIIAPIVALVLIVLGIFYKKKSSSNSSSSQQYSSVDPSHKPIASADDGYDSDNWDDYEEDIEFA